ncbi:MAG TPA: MHYT domain-containing protein [Acidiferrobacterales bacterium]|nr:MHYT domain-containing protein [Acidiferrobacterales bacterium]
MNSMNGTYDLTLVLASYVISVFGSYTALQLAGQITNLRDPVNRLWLLAAAVALGGGGIWSMHFVAMLAYVMPMAVTYDITLTLLSLVVSVAVTGVGFAMVCRKPTLSVSALLGGGLIMGVGVGAMHYTGMAAMRIEGTAHHDPMIVAVSIVIAIIVSTVALWIAFNLRKGWQKFISAFVMGAAVCGMHYTAMTGFSFTHVARTVDYLDSVLFTRDLATYIIVATIGVLSLSLVAVFTKELNDASRV